MIVVSGVLEIDPHHHEQAVAAGLEMMAATREEEGCISYAFYADLEQPGVFRVFEEWRDQSCLAKHFETPHMEKFREALQGVGIRGRDIKRYVVSEVSDL